MALVKATLQAELLVIYNEAKASAMTEAIFAEKMATAIDNYIKTATVTTVVVGTLPTGPVAASGTGGLT